MSRPGNFDNPVERVEEIYDKPILNLEIRKIEKIRNKLLILLLPVFLALTSGCSVMKPSALPSDNAKPPTSDAKGNQGNAEEKSDYYDEDSEDYEKWMDDVPGLLPPSNSKEFDIDRLIRGDQKYYRKCYYYLKCDQV